MTSAEFFQRSVEVLETIGVGAIVVGFGIAVLYACLYLVKTRSATDTYVVFRRFFGGVILLGLEVLVAADLIRSVALEQTLESVIVLGLLVLIRTILSFSIEIDITGNLPWREALTNSGAGTIKSALTDYPMPGRASKLKRGRQ
jgi:uncharacterized membrane protein